MTYVYFDASALAKRYVPEPGSLIVDYIFTRVPPYRQAVLAVAVGEVQSVFVRRRNARTITNAAYTLALSEFRTEILDATAVDKVEAGWLAIRRSLNFIERYSLNATDALVLRTALDLSAQLAADGNDLVLVASDRRLTLAAAGEGLPAFDPECQPAADFDSAFTA